MLSPYQQKAIDYDGHIALTANAGSGKTFVLAKRYVEIVTRQNLPLEKVVAITFTDKAAGELYSRIVKEIDSRLNAADNNAQKKILNRMRRQIISANISTIHSFCIDLLKEFAPYVNIDMNFAPIDTEHSEELKTQAFEKAYTQLIKNDNESLKNLIRYFGSKDLFLKQISSMFNHRKTIERLYEYYLKRDTEVIIDEWEKLFVRKALINFGPDFESIILISKTLNQAVKKIDASNEIADEVENALNSLPELTESNFLEFLKEFEKLKQAFLTKSGTVKKPKYILKLKGEMSSAVDELNELFAKIKFLEFTSEYKKIELRLAGLIKDLLFVYNVFNTEYNNYKKKNSYLDFEDLLLLTRKALQIEEVKKQMSGKYDYIMVDEYQDTNEIQYDIILPLIEEFRKGKLFIVGDEKQSIYGFRQADLRIFNLTKDEIAEHSNNKGILSLPHSFRLNPQPAAFINHLFRKLFSGAEKEFNEVKPEDLICAKEYKDEGKVGFLINKTKDYSEADLVASKIISLHNSGRPFGDITILCRKRGFFNELAQTFIKKNIPYGIIGSKGFYQNQHIMDFQNYLSFLVNPMDDASLLEILRSPFFYLSDDEIYKIKRINNGTLFDKLKLISDEKQIYNRTFNILKRHLELSKTLPIPDLIVDIIQTTKVNILLRERRHPEILFAAIDKLIDLAIKFQSDSFVNLFDFVEMLKEAIRTDADESQAELYDEQDKVKMMTIHQSKGLEFPVVFLYNTNSQIRIDTVSAKNITVDEEFGIVTAVPEKDLYFSEYKKTPHALLFNYYMRRKQLAEEKRLLYVALTRAEEDIYISADVSNRKTNLSWFSELTKALNIDVNESEKVLNEHLQFMDINNNFELSEKLINVNIQIESEISEESLPPAAEAESEEYKILTGKIKDRIKNDIYSATKLAVFSQCPMKYNLIYNYGLSRYQSIIRIEDDFEFNHSENALEENIPANVVGSLIHKILERDEPIESLRKFILNNLAAGAYEIEYLDNVVEEIYSLIEGFYSSDIYKELKVYSNYKNEFEIYLRHKDYFLFGIVDKLIIDGEKLRIVDYKTDKLNKITPEEKFASYELQLKFYAYILSKVFKDVKIFEVQLCFVREPEKSILKKYSPAVVNKFGHIFDEMINKISAEEFTKKLSHCSKCQFSNNKKECII